MTGSPPNIAITLVDIANALIASNNNLVQQLATSGVDTPAAHVVVLEAYDAYNFARTQVSTIFKSVIAAMAEDDDAPLDAIAGAAAMLDVIQAEEADVPSKEEYFEEYRRIARTNKREQ